VVVWVRAACATDDARGADVDPDDGGVSMRVESEVFADGGDEPVARSLTLFRDGVAWDFLEMPDAAAAKGKGQPPMKLVGIVLHDPARERMVVVDPDRHLKTQVEAIRLERLSVSLAKWARGSDDRLIRWTGGPDFESGLSEKEETLELVGPRVRYAVTHAAAPSPEAARSYRRFADTAILLKALLHPGGIPPFPRLALNRRLEAAAAIPERVTLEIEPKLGPLGGRPERLTCVHKTHPRLLSADLARIDEAQGHVGSAEAVELAAFVAAEPTAQRQDP
jgi:hypothetical protein